MAEARISLSQQDFENLVNGREVRVTAAGRSAVATPLTVVLALQDIGFDMMHELIDAAEVQAAARR